MNTRLVTGALLAALAATTLMGGSMALATEQSGSSSSSIQSNVTTDRHYMHESQPHMRSALKSLEKARQQLAIAEHDKGGNRSEALEYVNKAIEKVQQGMHWDNQHE